jgi:hypothetical protein
MSPGAREAILHAADLLNREAEALRASHTVAGTADWCGDSIAEWAFDDMATTAKQLHDIAFGVIE